MLACTCEPTDIGAALAARATAQRCLTEDTLATQMAFGRVRTGLEQNYPIRILFCGERAVTTALMAVLTEISGALETILGNILGGNVSLQHQNVLIRVLYS